MKLLRHLLAFVVLVALAAPALTTRAEDKKGDGKSGATKAKPAKIEWLKYDQGLAKARREGKHVLVNFTTAWCGYCKKMNRDVFSDKKVIAAIDAHFVAVKVDGDSKRGLDIDGYKITEKDLARREFGVPGYPTYWFLESDGAKLGYLRGYQPKEQFMKALTIVHERLYDTTATKSGGQQKKGGN